MASNNKIDQTPSTVATNALSAIPFGQVIGGPLKACIEAQSDAAQSTWKFIREVGLTEKEDGTRELTYVSFTYRRNGREATINVPLLTIVPIPYIAIKDIDIAFKANISASSSTSTTQSESLAVDFGLKTSASVNFLMAKASMEMNVGVSSKKDSKATAESKYSVEYTMDVAVKAGQDDMPAGMAKVLEMLNESIDTVDSGGELHSSTAVVQLSADGMKGAYITYKDDAGYYQTDVEKIGIEIKRYGESGNLTNASKGTDYILIPDDPGFVCQFKTAGKYQLQIGDKKTVIQVIE